MATTYKYKDYTESDAVKQSQAAYESHQASKPGDYQPSQYQTIADEALQQYLNRGDFSYDINGDALYQQYKDKYIQQGKMAMMDTVGQASALTGGYGNSYAVTAGNQAYQAHLQNLNDVVPELYQMAYDRYNQEGQDMLNQYSVASDRENQEYSKYQDALAAWQADRDHYLNVYNAERDYDYGKYSDNRSFDYGVYTNDKAFAYQQERDKVADQQWQAQFDEAKRQYEASLAASKAASYSSGSSGGSDGGGGGGYNNGSVSSENIKAMQKALGITADGLWGSESTAAAGGLTADEAWAAYQNGKFGNTGSTSYAWNKEKDGANWAGYDSSANASLQAAKGGSYYKDAYGELKEMKAAGASTSEASKYLQELLSKSYITPSEYTTLYQKYRNNNLK